MQMFRPPVPHPSWCNAIFTAKAVEKGGVIRRAVRDVERRGYHLIEVGGQFVVICNEGRMTVIC
jgi:hypothetical protein